MHGVLSSLSKAALEMQTNVPLTGGVREAFLEEVTPLVACFSCRCQIEKMFVSSSEGNRKRTTGNKRTMGPPQLSGRFTWGDPRTHRSGCGWKRRWSLHNRLQSQLENMTIVYSKWFSQSDLPESDPHAHEGQGVWVPYNPS